MPYALCLEASIYATRITRPIYATYEMPYALSHKHLYMRHPLRMHHLILEMPQSEKKENKHGDFIDNKQPNMDFHYRLICNLDPLYLYRLHSL
jgi:hypothetical protein